MMQVFAEIDIRPQRYKQDKRRIPLYKKADWEKIETQLTITNQYIQDHVNSESTDSLWNKFKSDLHTVLHEIGPHGSLLRYENYSRKGKGYIVTVNKHERKTKRALRTNCAT